MSKPPNIGEPKKNAIVTAVPKAIPTAIRRLFIRPVVTRRIKTN